MNDQRNFVQKFANEGGGDVFVEDVKLAERTSQSTVASTDYILMEDTDGAFHKILKSSFNEAVRGAFGDMLANLDKGTSISALAALGSTGNDLGSITPANLASVLGGNSDSFVTLFYLGKSSSTSQSKKRIIRLYRYTTGIFLIKTGNPSQISSTNIKLVYLSNRNDSLPYQVIAGKGNITLYYKWDDNYVYLFIDDTSYQYVETRVSLLTSVDWKGEVDVNIEDTPTEDFSQMESVTI